MTWKEKLVARILLIVAMMVAEGEVRDDVRRLSTHISASRRED